MEKAAPLVTSTTPFDVKKFVFKIISFLPWVIICMLLAYAGANIYLRYATQMHKLVSYVLVKDESESTPDQNLLRQLGVLPGANDVQNQVDILSSLSLAKAVVDSLNLNIKILTKGKIASSDLWESTSPFLFKVTEDSSGLAKPASYDIKLTEQNVSMQAGSKKINVLYGQPLIIDNRSFTFERNKKVQINAEGYSFLIQDKLAIAKSLRSRGRLRGGARDPGGERCDDQSCCVLRRRLERKKRMCEEGKGQ